jgi:lycopene beta-cyclase
MKTELHHTYDYIFCGAGASAGLMLLSMHDHGLLSNKSVLIIDRETKNRRDKTFCFWSEQSESIEKSLSALITQSWQKAILPGDIEASLKPYKYNHISSLDLYLKIDELSQFYQWSRNNEEVNHISKCADTFIVNCGAKNYRGNLVFDSRTPNYLPTEKGQTHLFQSFIGWHIKLLNEVVSTDSIRFMDFDVEQDGFTQFVYTLPNADATLLVEVTRFGSEKINRAEAECLLHNYIERKFGPYIKLDEEQGCIPMSNGKLDTHQEAGVVQLGARNYSIKPSTGYAFKKMYEHAQSITLSLIQGQKPSDHNKNYTSSRSGRFAFYDGLLLDILQNNPNQGKRIFETLFKRTPLPTILNFLDEKTTLKEELFIFARLPILPFLKSLVNKVISSNLFHPIILTILSLLLAAVPWHLEGTSVISSIILAAGFFLVGIPHGAVDHLIESKQWNYRKLPVFILHYLSVGSLMALLWYIAPNAGLILFLLYSAWHFGQADGALWKLDCIASILWGASLLAFILGSHLSETNSILLAMGTIPWPITISWWSMLPWTIWFISKRQYAGALTTCWMMLSCQLPLSIAFGIYFLGQHSITGWKHIREHLQMSNTSIWLHSLPFHLGAWAILAVFVLITPTFASDNASTWGTFFVFLACLSLPHVLAMNRVYRR